MSKTIQKLRFETMSRAYLGLCGMHAPRPIHDKVGYENAVEIVEAMAGFEHRFSADQGDYFELLSDLVLAYEEEHEKSLPEGKLPITARLKFLLESAGWNASDLGRFLGLDPTMGNKILRGERKLTTGHIAKLSGRFQLRAEYFI